MNRAVYEKATAAYTAIGAVAAAAVLSEMRWAVCGLLDNKMQNQFNKWPQAFYTAIKNNI